MSFAWQWRHVFSSGIIVLFAAWPRRDAVWRTRRYIPTTAFLVHTTPFHAGVARGVCSITTTPPRACAQRLRAATNLAGYSDYWALRAAQKRTGSDSKDQPMVFGFSPLNLVLLWKTARTLSTTARAHWLRAYGAPPRHPTTTPALRVRAGCRRLVAHPSRTLYTLPCTHTHYRHTAPLFCACSPTYITCHSSASHSSPSVLWKHSALLLHFTVLLPPHGCLFVLPKYTTPASFHSHTLPTGILH